MFNLKIPQSIFAHADGFLKATQNLQKPQLDPLCFAALVTNSAFASELYLKCLIHLETGQIYKDEHNLRKLFFRLKGKTQDAIEAKFAVEYEPHKMDISQVPEHLKAKAQLAAEILPKTLREALKEGALAFITWRYLYEDEREIGDAFGLFPLPQILREEILTRKPEWRFFGISRQKWSGPQPTSPAPKTPEQGAAKAPEGAGSL
jgi:HEPN domain-containing protein